MTLGTRRTHRHPPWMTLALAACLILAARPARGSISVQLPAPTQDAPGVLVSVDWLAEHLQDSLLVLLHV